MRGIKSKNDFYISIKCGVFFSASIFKFPGKIDSNRSHDLMRESDHTFMLTSDLTISFLNMNIAINLRKQSAKAFAILTYNKLTRQKYVEGLHVFF